MSGTESYAAYIRLLPTLVQAVLGLVQGVRRLAEAGKVEVPDIEALERITRELRQLADLPELRPEPPRPGQQDR